MNIKLQKLIAVFNERKTFFNNHPELYRFVLKTLEEKPEEGTEIELLIRKPQGEAVSERIVLDPQDMKFMDSICELFTR